MEFAMITIGALGSFVFAISGALTAMKMRFDPFGVFIIAFVTALGGGTLRDIFLRDRDVFWLAEYWHIYFIIAGTVAAMAFRRTLLKLHRPLLFFDAIGLGLFTVVGAQIGIENDLSYLNCILLGTVTGTFGGVIRDILVNVVPVIFRKEIYATISIGGAAIYLLLCELSVASPYRQFIPICIMILARLLIIRYKTRLPLFYRSEEVEMKTGK